MSFGAVEIFFILVVVGLVAYVLWRLLIRPRRMRPPR
jgi:flagellar biosynthesis/type III secretory pathway M-ring protein FliF/YscJ